jgi:hypothetical protein
MGELDCRDEWATQAFVRRYELPPRTDGASGVLQPTPEGNFLVLVLQEGPGSESFGASLASSDDDFDRWFMENVAALHGPMPPATTRYL